MSNPERSSSIPGTAWGYCRHHARIFSGSAVASTCHCLRHGALAQRSSLRVTLAGKMQMPAAARASAASRLAALNGDGPVMSAVSTFEGDGGRKLVAVVRETHYICR